MARKNFPRLMEKPEGLTTKEILKAIPKLTPGGFNHWVKYRSGIFPIGMTPAGHGGMTDVFPYDTVERVLRVMEESQQ